MDEKSNFQVNNHYILYLFILQLLYLATVKSRYCREVIMFDIHSTHTRDQTKMLSVCNVAFERYRNSLLLLCLMVHSFPLYYTLCL